MELILNLTVFLSMYLSIIILDYIWLGHITKKFIIREFGKLIKVKNGKIEIKIFVGLLAWFLIALGCLIFSVNQSSNIYTAILLGSTFGFISYGIYDLTNLAFINNYSKKFVIVDILWGTFVCSVISGVGFFVKTLF